MPLVKYALALRITPLSRNISERKRTEGILRENKKRYKSNLSVQKYSTLKNKISTSNPQF
jgi:hypothetical protein